MRRHVLLVLMSTWIGVVSCGSDHVGGTPWVDAISDGSDAGGYIGDVPRPSDAADGADFGDSDDDAAEEIGLDVLVDSRDLPDEIDSDWSIDDAIDEDDEPMVVCPSADDRIEPAVKGTVYRDGDESSDTYYAQTITPPEDEPLEEIEIALIGVDEERTTLTCPSGEFSFGSVEEGTYVLDVLVENDSVCTSTNSPRRFPEAVREGTVTIVTFGDSLPVYSETPTFPERLATFVGTLAEVENVNIAVAGSMAVDWLPETNFFETRLRPQLANADVVVMSLGGNDLQNYFVDVETTDPEDLLELAAEFPAFQAEVEANLITIIEEIQVSAAHLDVVYLLYPNYAYSDVWVEYAGEWIGLVQSGLDRALNQMRENMSEVDHIVLVDMYAATADEHLDDLLMDPLHLNAAGTLFWAREIFQTLGGAVVGEESFGMERMFGYGPGEDAEE